jgi:hypothetical protein
VIGHSGPGDGRNEVDLLVLGLVRWARPDGSAASLTRSEIDEIGHAIALALDVEMLTDHDLDDTYYRMQIVPGRNGRGERNCRAFEKLVPETFREHVQSVQVGFYHNRLIVRYQVRRGRPSLHTLRVLRQELAQIVVDVVFRPLVDVFGDGHAQLRLLTVRHTALQLVPCGTRVLRKEVRKLRKGGYSRAYSMATTTFGVHISGSRLAPIAPRHYVRLSMSGATVYLAGRRWPDDLLIALIDAMYYGGLYGEEEGREGGAELIVEPAWSDNQLLRVFALLRDSLRASAGHDSALRAAQVGAVFAMASAVIGMFALVVR